MVQRAVLATRLAVRRQLLARFGRAGGGASVAAGGSAGPADVAAPGAPKAPALLLVGVSGGADSLALAQAAAYEGGRMGFRVGAVCVDHGLQEGSAAVAERAAGQCRSLGLNPVINRRVSVRASGAGPEADARTARYAAMHKAACETGAVAVLLAHTRSDQAEQVLLALARGSGLTSLAGIPPEREMDGVLLLRPFLGASPEITRQTCEDACREYGLDFWRDPHNADPAYARVRVRTRLLPALADELGEGVLAGLARTADLAREENAAIAWAAERLLSEQLRRCPGGEECPATSAAHSCVTLPAAKLAALPRALAGRVVRLLATREFGASLSRAHADSVLQLVFEWHGQGPAHVPGMWVVRVAGVLHCFQSRALRELRRGEQRRSSLPHQRATSSAAQRTSGEAQ